MNDELGRVTEELEREAQECARLEVPQWGEVWRAYKELASSISNAIDVFWMLGEFRWAAGSQSRLIDTKRQARRHLASMRERHVEAERSRKHEAGNE